MDQNEQLLVKLQFEERLRRELRSIFNRIRMEFILTTAVGNTIRATKYEAAFKTALQTHYARVQKAFLGVVENNAKQDSDEDLKDEILAALLLWSEQNVSSSVNSIVDTTQLNMDRAIEQARQAFSDGGIIDYSQREIASAAAAILRRKLSGRETTIATTETQAPAESTKLIEAFGLAGLAPATAVTRQRIGRTASKKQWVTVGDERVRDLHVRVNGQIKPINQPFVVNDERLMYPGDNFYGASANNTINCRCSAFYTFNLA